MGKTVLNRVNNAIEEIRGAAARQAQKMPFTFASKSGVDPERLESFVRGGSLNQAEIESVVAYLYEGRFVYHAKTDTFVQPATRPEQMAPIANAHDYSKKATFKAPPSLGTESDRAHRARVKAMLEAERAEDPEAFEYPFDPKAQYSAARAEQERQERLADPVHQFRVLSATRQDKSLDLNRGGRN